MTTKKMIQFFTEDKREALGMDSVIHFDNRLTDSNAFAFAAEQAKKHGRSNEYKWARIRVGVSGKYITILHGINL